MKEYKFFGITVAYDERSDLQRERDLMDIRADSAQMLSHLPVIGERYAEIEDYYRMQSLHLSGKIIQEMQGSPWNPAERHPTEEEWEEYVRSRGIEE